MQRHSLHDHIDYDDLVGQLAVHPSKTYRRRDTDILNEIILHHSATTAGTAQSFARYQTRYTNLELLNNRKLRTLFPGIGYHYVTDEYGIHRTQPLEVRTWHTSGHNTYTVGLCHTGNFDLRPPTDEEYADYIRMILLVDAELGRQLPINYHNHYSSYKTCPGSLFDREYFYDHLREVRRVVW